MQHLTYQVPESMHRSTKLSIKDVQGDLLFLLQKRPHKFMAGIFHATLRFGLPYTYQISTADGKSLYSIDCWFPGMHYELTDHLSSETISIFQHRVQLTEKAYSFRLSNQDYHFEKDHTGTGYLNCGHKRIARVSLSSSLKISEVDTIQIVAETEELASLSAVLFHTFYFYNA